MSLLCSRTQGSSPSETKPKQPFASLLLALPPTVPWMPARSCLLAPASQAASSGDEVWNCCHLCLAPCSSEQVPPQAPQAELATAWAFGLWAPYPRGERLRQPLPLLHNPSGAVGSHGLASAVLPTNHPQCHPMCIYQGGSSSLLASAQGKDVLSFSPWRF